MRQRDFIVARQERWDTYADQLKRLRGRRTRRKNDRNDAGHDKNEEIASFPENYRSLCNDLALARTRGYSLSLVDRLENWVMQGHAFLYQPRSSLSRDIGRFFSCEFPVLVRQEWRLSLLACLLLFGPMVWLFWYIGSTPEFVYRILSPDMVDTYESMYSGDEKRFRTAEDDLVMFAFYIMNNIGVALRTFAAGLVFGIGAAMILLFNGIQIGAVAAHLSFEGYHQNFSSFVIGHGAFELPAIALAGAAGARMGLSLLVPGGLSRLDALRSGARRAVRLLYGVIAMLLLAAGLEGFWSASAVSASTKYIVGTVLWLLVICYFLFVGRGRSLERRAD